MKILINGNQLAVDEKFYFGGKPEEGSWLDQLNDLSDSIIGTQTETVLKPFGNFIKDVSIDFWNWFIVNLPDITGYITIASGIAIIISCMIGTRFMMKSLGVYAAILITALCILGGVES